MRANDSVLAQPAKGPGDVAPRGANARGQLLLGQRNHAISSLPGQVQQVAGEPRWHVVQGEVFKAIGSGRETGGQHLQGASSHAGISIGQAVEGVWRKVQHHRSRRCQRNELYLSMSGARNANPKTSPGPRISIRSHLLEQPLRPLMRYGGIDLAEERDAVFQHGGPKESRA